jgi:hypothetical protein
MLTTFPSKHILTSCEEKRTHTLLPCLNSEPARAASQEPLNLLLSSGGKSPRRPLKPDGRKRRPLWINWSGKMPPKMRSPVTVCTAAICTVERTLGGVTRAILGVSDRMLTSDDVEYEPKLHTKIYGFQCDSAKPTKAVLLGAGDSSVNFTLFTRTHRQVIQSQIPDVEEIADLHAKEMSRYRLECAERLYLAPLGLDVRSFLSRQQKLVPELALDIAQRLRDHNLGVEDIIAGIDQTGPHIYSIDDNCVVNCHDGSGFWAAGSGCRQFETLFMASGYDTTWPVPQTLLLLYSAKKRAEASPGVGHMTDLFIIDQDGFRLLSLYATAEMEKHYQNLETMTARYRDLVLGQMKQDPRLLEPMSPYLDAQLASRQGDTSMPESVPKQSTGS